MKLIYILAAVLIFGILVAVHELGHFLAAKLCGVRVNEFSIGMGPAVWSRKRGETQYSLRVLPIGGLREKLLAASRAEMRLVLLPRDNEKDLKEVPEEILKTLSIVFVEQVDEVLPLALEAPAEDIFRGTADGPPLAESLRCHPEPEVTTAQ